MDYMQRQLDGDLDERETEILMNHTRHCPECARMFERLQLLSAGLENLPKVTPGYSLVDAILPRLAELQANGPAAGIDAAPAASEEQELAAGRSGRSVPQRRWNRYTLGALGGVVAAGIAFGLLIGNLQSGEPLRIGGSANTAASDAATGSAADAGASPAAQESAAERNMPKEGNEVKIGSAQDNAKGLMNKSSAELNSSNVKEHSGEALKTDGTADTFDAPQDIIKNSDPQPDKAYSPNYSSTGSGEVPKSDSADSGNQSGNQVKEPAPAGEKRTVLGITAAPETATHEWVSPDGRYKAAFVDSRLKVYVVEDGTMLFESPKWPSGIASAVWAPDSRSLTYETKSEDGSTIVYKVEPAIGTEELQTK
jgi:hypothetical protein